MKKGEEEISIDELYRRLDKLEKQNYIHEDNSNLKTKKVFVILTVSLICLGVFIYLTINNFNMLKSGFASTTESVIEILTIDEDANLNDTLGLYVSIKGAKINLSDEETSLKNNLETKCTTEKGALEATVRLDEKAICTKEKTIISAELLKVETQLKEVQKDFDDCNESLAEYETGV